jgi:hypothetical protein
MHPRSLDNTRPAGTDAYTLDPRVFPRLPPDAWRSLTPADEPRDWLVWLLAAFRLASELAEYGFRIPTELAATLREHAADVAKAVELAEHGDYMRSVVRYTLYDAYGDRER